MATIESLTEQECTGCGACVSSCPTGAINFFIHENGFYYPKIDKEKCILCETCKFVCPILSPVEKEVYTKPLTYAGWSHDDSIRVYSSSGGICSEVANKIIQNNGVVYGAAFDSYLQLNHVKVSDEHSLYKIRGSKYVQSKINNVYTEIIKLNKEGVEILFCGAPCQVASLLNITQYNKLTSHIYTCDLICHGVTSQTLFNQYLKYLSIKNHTKVIEYNFRDKRLGWERYGSSLKNEDGSEIFTENSKDPFMIGYLKNYYLRPSCYDCHFANIPRNSDITLGDYWGAPKNVYDPKGVSVILINNDFGQRLISEVKNITIREASLNDIKINNPRLVNGKLSIPKDLIEFNKLYEKEGFFAVIDSFLQPMPRYMVLINKIKSYISRARKKLKNVT